MKQPEAHQGVGKGEHRGVVTAVFVLGLLFPAVSHAQEPPPSAAAGWDNYIRLNDRDLEEGRSGSDAFLSQDVWDNDEMRRCREEVREGKICITKVTLTVDDRFEVEVDDALVHHWGGTVFVPGVTLDEALEFIRSFEDYATYFDEVVDSGILEESGDTLRTFLKLKRTKVITVHYNTEHEVTFTRVSPTRARSISIATKIRELDNAGEANEREKEFGEDQGFLWRLNANWNYEERDGGVVLEAEIISLSRPIPFGLGWMVGPFVESIPRESLEKTLSTLRDALMAQAGR